MSFSIEAEEFTLARGSSGRGKTIVLNTLEGLRRPKSDLIEIDVGSIIEMSEKDFASPRLQKIEFAFQDYNLVYDSTVGENSNLPLRLSKEGNGALVEYSQEMSGQTYVSNYVPKRISGGESQRTAIAQVIVNEWTPILEEETTDKLDIKDVENVVEMQQLARGRFGATIVLAMYYTQKAMNVSATMNLHEERKDHEISVEFVIRPLITKTDVGIRESSNRTEDQSGD